MQIHEDIWRLMARSIFGEASPQEERELQDHLKDNPALQQQFEVLSQTLRHSQTLENEQQLTATRIIEKTRGLQKLPRSIRLKKYWPIAAASVMAVIVASLFFVNRIQPSTVAMPEQPHLIAQNGERRQSVLPDGSKVWLNSGSRLYFINDFKGATREVRLDGEAFFDVVKNPARPFIVHAANVDIKVLGTAFNVKAYSDADVETTLYRGLINIARADDKNFQPIMLYPNQKIILPRHAAGNKAAASVAQPQIPGFIAIRQIDSTKIESLRIETAWMYNRLEFRGDDFAALAKKLERWYNVTIVFKDEAVKKLSFNGSFERENIEQAMLALSTANFFQYKIKNNEIFISSAK